MSQVLVLGSGPSLLSFGHDRIKAMADEHTIICINHAIDVYPTPDVWFGHRVMEPGGTYTPTQRAAIKNVPLRYDVGGKPDKNFTPFPLGGNSRYPSHNSGVAAILWAHVKFGVQEVKTVGIDCTKENAVMKKERGCKPDCCAWAVVRWCQIRVLKPENNEWIPHPMEAIKL